MTLLEHARTELDALQVAADQEEGAADEFQRSINESLLQMIATFAETGHSGGSASYAIEMLARLLRYEPLSPLTGHDDEWVDVTEYTGYACQQNKRCNTVFRERGHNGKWIAYDIERVIFREWRGPGTFTNGYDSARRVRFPYAPPKPRYTRFRRLSTAWAHLLGQHRPRLAS
jgi:hypothetical protein